MNRGREGTVRWKIPEGTERLLFLVILFVAAVLRLRYLGYRSLWNDEAWVANLVLDGGLGNLLAESDKGSIIQPPLFSYAIALLIELAGRYNEAIFRLVPCIVGIAAVPALYLLTRRLCGPLEALIASSLLALSEPMIRYSQELKQYSGGVLAAILLFLIVEKIREEGRWLHWAVLGVTAGAGFAYDLGVLFPAAAAYLYLLWWCHRSGSRAGYRGLAVASAIFAPFAAVVLILFVFRPQMGRYVAYWSGAFVSCTGLGSTLGHVAGLNWDLVRYLLSPVPLIGLVLASAGVASLWIRGIPRVAYYLLAPLGLALAGACLHRYPYFHRLLLFAAPILLLAVAAGAAEMFGWLNRARPRSLALIPLLIIPAVGWKSVPAYLWAPERLQLEELRPVMEHVTANIRQGDAIYRYYGANFAFRYYYRGHDGPLVLGKPHRIDPSQYPRDLEEVLRPGMRLWIVFAHYIPEEKEILLNALDPRGEMLDRIERVGAAAYLYRID